MDDLISPFDDRVVEPGFGQFSETFRSLFWPAAQIKMITIGEWLAFRRQINGDIGRNRTAAAFAAITFEAFLQRCKISEMR